ncbi:MAG: DUF4178 domain-containing protein [Gemmatimonadaceae bacterium]
MVSTAGAPVNTKAAGLNCPSCGASLTLSTAGWSVTVVCATCGAVLDAQDPNLRILQRQEQRITVQPHIAMGTRGTWKGVAWDVVGFQQVGVTVEGTLYSWLEYVLFNPYQGFLYLTEYQGHWNVVEKLHRRPDEDAGTRDAIQFNGLKFKHFQSADATTLFALGEFPWEVTVGDTVRSHDYVSPPYMLSAESTENETTWSLGTYTDGKAIARAFAVGGSFRSPTGVFANQPNDQTASAGSVRRVFKFFVLALVAMLVINVAMARKDDVFSGAYKFDRTQGDTTAFVTDPFELKGRASSVDFNIETDLENDWMYLNLALIDETSGQAYDVGRQVSYYHGSDGDGSWSEGGRKDHFRLGAIPSGKYILRVAPEGDETSRGVVNYKLSVKRDVPSYLFYIVAFVALLIPAALASAPAMSFEQRRWAESDHAPASSSSSDDDDD